METKKVNTTAITALIILLGFTSPLSTDMCLPALSTIAADYEVSYSIANLIIITFFFFMAVCTLIAGPLSDRFGRKKVMLVSLVVYTLGNACCVMAKTITLLIVARSFAACGAGGMLNSSTALTKDVFSGRSRDRTLAIVQVFQIVAPLLAPVIGAFLLDVFSWHATFAVLSAIGLVEIVIACARPETQPADERGASTIKGTFMTLGRILHNRAFTVMLLTVGCLQACFMAYLATSSYIYQIEFAVSPAVYSIFFSCSALVTMAAPAVYMKLLYDRFEPKTIYRANQALVLVGGLLIVGVGALNASGALDRFGIFAAVFFWAAFLLVAFNNSIARPLGMSILLKQHQKDAGSLSALINFGLYIIGLAGMVIGSLPWQNYLIALGCIIVCIVAIGMVLFFIATRPAFGLKWTEESCEEPESPKAN